MSDNTKVCKHGPKTNRYNCMETWHSQLCYLLLGKLTKKITKVENEGKNLYGATWGCGLGQFWRSWCHFKLFYLVTTLNYFTLYQYTCGCFGLVSLWSSSENPCHSSILKLEAHGHTAREISRTISTSSATSTELF